jgi:hypothetical protein
MKKLTTLLIFTVLTFSIITTVPKSQVLSFKEGIYELSDFNISQSENYTIQNISPSDTIYMIIFDENQHELQSIHLSPKSINFRLIPLQSNYRIVLVGNGEAVIS